jgi:large subunit ribosomal protein L18
MANTKRDLFLKRRLRVRNKIKATSHGRLRLSVHRSSKNISVQLIDDIKGVTIAAASTLEKDLGLVGKNNVEAAAKIGAAIAERAKKAGVEECSKSCGRRILFVGWAAPMIRAPDLFRAAPGLSSTAPLAGATIEGMPYGRT